jgi:ribonuclease HI
MNETLYLYFDGSCEPINPGGKMGFGTLIKRGDVRIFENSELVAAAPGNTNNIAEYRALINGLQWLIDNGMTDEQITVFGDSNLVIQQMSGNWGTKGGRYYPFFVQAKQMREQFTNIGFQWIPRAENVECDQLSRSQIEQPIQ